MSAVGDVIGIVSEFIRTRWRLSRLRTSSDVALFQERRLARHLPRLAKIVPFYRGYGDVPLDRWPLMDKASSLKHFGELNSAGITPEEAWAIADGALGARNSSGKLRDLTIGTSTGTSGNRGLFVVSPQERRAWLGSILAKALPDVAFRSHRIALFLSTANELYDAHRSRRVQFSFHDLREGVEAHRSHLQAFAPTVLIAPPKVLREILETGFDIAPRHVFSGAEMLDDHDRIFIERGFGVRIREIYQATEGFLGIACDHGTMHLNEDTVAFEFEPVAGDPTLVTPILTDLRRETQAMVRYRMNDLLRLGGSCPCGSPFRTVTKIEGRTDDVFDLPSMPGPGRTRIFPETLRAAVQDTRRELSDFRVLQDSSCEITIQIPVDAPVGIEEDLKESMEKTLLRAGARAEIKTTRGILTPFDRKLRRIERTWRP